MLYDVFICHASEDKDSLVRPLAEVLRNQRVEVWYDEFALKPGDSLRRAIDKGLASSRLGVVVLSKQFFTKSWTQWELDGLVERELAAQDPVVIPVWHGVGHAEVMAYSPPLAGKVAIRSEGGPEKVAQQLLKVLHPQGSTLLIARDLVLDCGGTPPVITDDWWLDAVETSASNAVEGTFQEHGGWGRWGFPLPPRGDSPEERGRRLGWAAMQMTWMRAAREQKITQVTRPEVVLDFIAAQPGLNAMCSEHPAFLATYAPQLVIPGFSGPFSDVFDEVLANSTVVDSRASLEGEPCITIRPVWIAFRHPRFNSRNPAALASDFVLGHGIGFGPQADAYATIDYVAWFLSSASEWLPELHRQSLLVGLKKWATWPWSEREDDEISEHPFPGNEVSGTLQGQLFEATSAPRASRLNFSLTDDSTRDLDTRLAHSARVLSLPERSSELADRFLRAGFIGEWFKQQQLRGAIGKTKKARTKRGARA